MDYKIYAVPSHTTEKRTSGVDMARVIQPMQHLNGFKYKGHTFETKIFNPKDKDADWRKIAKEYDLIFFNYTVSAWAFAHMGASARHEGIPLVLDTDDNLWNVQPDNPSYPVFKDGSEHLRNFTSICNEVDHITTTNSYLKNVIRHNTQKRAEDISVLPNYIDLKLYKYRPKFKDTNDIQLLHFGSTTHFADLANEDFAKGIDMVFKQYPNVKLVTVGAFNPNYKRRWGARYENGFGHEDVYKWINEKFPKYLGESDILVVPLEDNLYTRCKSNIKWLEASSASLPGVWQNIRQYQECIDGTNGFLAYTAQEWYEGISKMIDDKQLRKSMGKQAFNNIQDWRIEDKIHTYAQMFIDVIDRHKK